MLSKNTILDLWSELGDIPTSINSNAETVVDAEFLGWPVGTNVEEIWHWFDEQFKDYGGVYALMYENPQPERKFQVETPAGIIECYTKHEKDNADDYPGVYIDVRHTAKQLAGVDVGDLAAVVEYESANGYIQTVAYELEREEPAHIEAYTDIDTPDEMNSGEFTYGEFMARYEPEMCILDVYDMDGNMFDPDGEIPADAIVTGWCRMGDTFELVVQLSAGTEGGAGMIKSLPVRVPKELLQKGLRAGLIQFIPEIPETGVGVMARIGEGTFFFAGAEGESMTPAEYIKNVPEDDLIEELFDAVNSAPINGETEDVSTEAMYYRFWLEESLGLRECN